MKTHPLSFIMFIQHKPENKIKKWKNFFGLQNKRKPNTPFLMDLHKGRQTDRQLNRQPTHFYSLTLS